MFKKVFDEAEGLDILMDYGEAVGDIVVFSKSKFFGRVDFLVINLTKAMKTKNIRKVITHHYHHEKNSNIQIFTDGLDVVVKETSVDGISINYFRQTVNLDCFDEITPFADITSPLLKEL